MQNQSSSWQSPATPRLVQWLCGLLDGTSINNTKFVEWPVVDNTPRRAVVLYTGHLYIGRSSNLDISLGRNKIVGKGSNKILGRDSPTTLFSRSHLAPSRNRPWKYKNYLVSNIYLISLYIFQIFRYFQQTNSNIFLYRRLKKHYCGHNNWLNKNII